MHSGETFQVDGIELGFGESRFTFADGLMHVHLIARAAPHEARPDLFEQRYGYRQPAIRVEDLSFPTPACRTTVRFEAGPAANRTGLWLDGFSGNPRLEGEVRVEDDLFVMDGELRPDYGHKHGQRILIRKLFEPGAVDPCRYSHTDLSYALTLDPMFVANLRTNASHCPQLEGLGTLANLRVLSLYGYDLPTVFDEFHRFTSLRTLELGGLMNLSERHHRFSYLAVSTPHGKATMPSDRR